MVAAVAAVGSGWCRPSLEPPGLLRPPVTATGTAGGASTSDVHLLRCCHRSHDGPARGEIKEVEHVATTAAPLVIPSRQVAHPRGADGGRGHPTSHTTATQPARFLQGIPEHIDRRAHTVDLGPRITGVPQPHGVH